MPSDNLDGRSGAQPRNGHLQLALQYTSDSWFPVNPETEGTIVQILAHPQGEDWRARILSELKCDAALYCATLRELALQMNSRNIPDNPAELFNKVPIRDLHWVLNRSAKKFSRHGFTPDELQRTRLLETVVSSSASETIASLKGCDTDLAFFCAQMRQLGMSLVGWNYPHVFKRATGLLKEQQELDEVIGRILGFSPSQLVISLARRWGFSPRVLGLLEPKPSRIDLLSDVCVLSDKIAKASVNSNYPNKERDWNEVCVGIEALGGATVWETLAQKISNYCRHYVKAAGELTVPSKIVALLPVKHTTDHGLMAKNEYLALCSPDFQELMRRCYSMIVPDGISKHAVDQLCQVLLPKAGFYRGCLYFVDPSSQKLAPRIPVGEARLADYQPMNQSETIRAISGSLAKAVASNQPYQLAAVDAAGEPITCFACKIGSNQFIGALVLERRGAIGDEENQSITVQIKAIRQILHDALQVY